MTGYSVALSALALSLSVVCLWAVIARDWQAGGLEGLELAAFYIIPAAIIGGAITATVLLLRRP